MKSSNRIKIDDLCIDLSTLKSKEDLIAQFKEDGATHSTLMDFCEEYLERYHNELCWQYPITDELHLGMFFVLVSEGIFVSRMTKLMIRIMNYSVLRTLKCLMRIPWIIS